MGTRADFPPGIQGKEKAPWLRNLSQSPGCAALAQPSCSSRWSSIHRVCLCRLALPSVHGEEAGR